MDFDIGFVRVNNFLVITKSAHKLSLEFCLSRIPHLYCSKILSQKYLTLKPVWIFLIKAKEAFVAYVRSKEAERVENLRAEQEIADFYKDLEQVLT